MKEVHSLEDARRARAMRRSAYQVLDTIGTAWARQDTFSEGEVSEV